MAESALNLPFSLQPVPPPARVLNSWKEIAAYLGRGVRTVQRWEQELNLPVHRPRGAERSAVLAFPRELDQWLARTPLHHNGNGSDAADIADGLLDAARGLLEHAERLVRVDRKHRIEAAQVADSVRKIVSELTLMTSGADTLHAVPPPAIRRIKSEDPIVPDKQRKPAGNGKGRS